MQEQKVLTTLESLSAESQLKVKKYSKTADALKKLQEAEHQFNSGFDRILNFQYDITPEVKEALDFLLGEALDKIPVNLSLAVIVARLLKSGDHNEWTSIGFEALTLFQHMFRSLLVTGRDQAIKFSSAYDVFNKPFQLLSQLEDERKFFATNMTECDNAFNRELQLSPLNSAEKKELEALKTEIAGKKQEALKEMNDKYEETPITTNESAPAEA